MSRADDLSRVLQCGIVAVIRADSDERLVEVARALAAGGVEVLEITFTVPRAEQALRRVADALGETVLLGAGTVLDPETARAALLAGARFLVSPTLNFEVIRLGHRYDCCVFPGAFTPTEVLAAWEAGADAVKVFPVDAVGPGYLKALRGPLPQVRLLPTGGIDLANAADYLKAGACALGVGGSLVDPRAVREGDFSRLTDLARQFTAAVRGTR